MIDFHVHLAGSGCCQSGIVLSKKFRRRPTFVALRFLQGITNEQLETDIDRLWLKRIADLISKSQSVDKGVGLCLDQVYAEDGTLLNDKTQLHVPNAWGARAADSSDGRILFGASVHPYRKDAIEELRRVKSNNAFLVKWLPSMMGIDPASDLCTPFYNTLRELNIPLLTHTAHESTFASAWPGWIEKNHVSRLRVPLKLGVSVIAAHAGTPTQIDELEALANEFPNFWADTSGLFNPIRVRSAVTLFKRAQNSVLKERLLYGSDWPIPAMPVFLLDQIGVSGYREVSRSGNPFDRDSGLKTLLGFTPEMFERNEEALLASLKD